MMTYYVIDGVTQTDDRETVSTEIDPCAHVSINDRGLLFYSQLLYNE